MSVVDTLFRLDEAACSIEPDPLDPDDMDVVIRVVWVARWPLSLLLPGQAVETFVGSEACPWHRPSGEWASVSMCTTLDGLHWHHKRQRTVGADDGDDVWAEILAALDGWGLGHLRPVCEARRALGVERYGHPVQRARWPVERWAAEGDAEALDLAVYRAAEDGAPGERTRAALLQLSVEAQRGRKGVTS